MQHGERVTISDVARQAGVSVASVSRVIHGNASVADDIRQRVRRAVEELGYVPDRSAQILKTGRSHTILHVVPDIMNPYYAAMYRSLRGMAAEHGYQTVLFDTEEKAELELRAVASLSENGYDGMVFASIGRDAAVLNALKAAGRPVVLTCDFEQTDIDAYFGVAGRGVYTAAKHLLDLGHRRVAYAGGQPKSIINITRRGGYLQALKDAGIPADHDLIFEMDFSMNGGYRAGIYFSAIPSRPTAICAANDMIAMGVMQALQERGVRVPDDVSVTGEDDIPFARICRPPLTTIQNSGENASSKALRLLLDRIEGGYEGDARIFAVSDRTLILRGSTMPPKETRRDP